MKLSSDFKTNGKLETEGVWVDLGNGKGVKVARAGNPANRKLLKRLVAPHKMALRSETLPDDVLEKITVQCMARTILLDWKGPIVLDDDEKPVPYSYEAAVFALSRDPDDENAQANFRDQIAAISTDMKIFQEITEEAAAKN